jgi:hypothetical protein
VDVVEDHVDDVGDRALQVTDGRGRPVADRADAGRRRDEDDDAGDEDCERVSKKAQGAGEFRGATGSSSPR